MNNKKANNIYLPVLLMTLIVVINVLIVALVNNVSISKENVLNSEFHGDSSLECVSEEESHSDEMTTSAIVTNTTTNTATNTATNVTTTISTTVTTKSTKGIQSQNLDDIIAGMSIEEKVGQLFLFRASDSEDFLNLLSKTYAGGIVFFGKDFKNKTSAQVQAMTKRMQNASDGRMFMAVDEEGGSVVRMSSNPNLRSSKYQSPSKLFQAGGMDAIKNDTIDKCKFLKKYGINLNFAPVADVCTSSKGFMYSRAFQKDAEQTSEYVSTVVKTMKSNGVVSCVKHFPGYGNSAGDTHSGLDVNEKSLDELKSVDLLPFGRGINEGVPCIMVTHTIINSIDDKNPASLSSKVIGLIRNDYGYNGLIITDGMDMGAIIDFSGNSGKACVMAIQAGSDLICTPKNALDNYNAVLKAVKNGYISEQRIDQSVRRIIKTKIAYGLYA